MIICADDYGIHDSVNSAILELIRLNKINSVSVLINKADIHAVNQLKNHSDKVRIGLHLDWGNVNKQISLFYSSFGFYPAYYDGHRHCHVYPFFSNYVISCIKKIPAEKYYIRSLNLSHEVKKTDSSTNRLYLRLLEIFNTKFISLLKKNNMATNDFIFGAFNSHMNIENIFRLFKNSGGENDIFFFHPAIDDLKNCGISRNKEYEFILNQ